MLWGHRTCITKLADVSRNGLTKIQKAYKLSRDKDYEYPAVQVLYDVNLLRQLKFAGDEEPDNWDQESVKRSWIIDLIRNEGRQVPVSLPQDDSRPPLHKNTFKMVKQKSLELQLFKEFVDYHSSPTGPIRSGKSHYLLPIFQRIRPPSKIVGGGSVAAQNRFERHKEESLTYLFNISLKESGQSGLSIGHSTIEKWFKTYFPSYALSPHATDYCDTCAEYKEQISSAKKSLSLFISSGAGAEESRKFAEELVASYESLLREHNKLA